MIPDDGASAILGRAVYDFGDGCTRENRMSIAAIFDGASPVSGGAMSYGDSRASAWLIRYADKRFLIFTGRRAYIWRELSGPGDYES